MTESTPIVVKQVFNAKINVVWKAITDVEQMRVWYFPNIPDFKPKVGFKTQFLIQNEGRNFTHNWTVKEVMEQKLIGYSWHFEEYSGKSYSTFELRIENDKTLLTLKSEVIEKFPKKIPEFKPESGQAGWAYLITQSLTNYLTQTK